MKCHTCGGQTQAIISDMPFKLDTHRIVIFKNLPVLQCSQCGEHLIEDAVMVRVEEMLNGVDASAELEIVRYAA
ncbi:MAG: YgiT-type zinc finger protein [Pseudomonadota bacterium]